MRPLIATPTVGAKVQQIGNESHEDSDLNDESRCRTEGCEENPTAAKAGPAGAATALTADTPLDSTTTADP